jgi:hypothetical protein
MKQPRTCEVGLYGLYVQTTALLSLRKSQQFQQFRKMASKFRISATYGQVTDFARRSENGPTESPPLRQSFILNYSSAARSRQKHLRTCGRHTLMVNTRVSYSLRSLIALLLILFAALLLMPSNNAPVLGCLGRITLAGTCVAVFLLIIDWLTPADRTRVGSKTIDTIICLLWLCFMIAVAAKGLSMGIL